MSGLTLRQLGFENGPLDEFSLPSDLVVSTAVDQPNVVTIVLARPSPETVEDYLRATLPNEGFAIDARADAGEGDDVRRQWLDRRLHRHRSDVGDRAASGLTGAVDRSCTSASGRAGRRARVAAHSPRSASSRRSSGRLMPTTLW